MYNFDEEYAETYKEKCECGNEIEVSTQKDENPTFFFFGAKKLKIGNEIIRAIEIIRN